MNRIFTIASKNLSDICQIILIFAISMKFYVNTAFLYVFVIILFISFSLVNFIAGYFHYELSYGIMNAVVLITYYALMIHFVVLMINFVVLMVLDFLIFNDTLIRNLVLVASIIFLRLKLNMLRGFYHDMYLVILNF